MTNEFKSYGNHQSNTGKTRDVKDPWATGLRAVLHPAPPLQNHAAIKSGNSGTASISSSKKASATVSPKRQSSWLQTVLLERDVEIKAGKGTSAVSKTSNTTPPVLPSAVKKEPDLQRDQ
jgi:hypothetical protein